jgi:hypothetical protein
MKNYIKTLKLLQTEQFRIQKGLPHNWQIKDVESLIQYKFVLSEWIVEPKIFNLSNDIKEYLLLTKNKVYERKLPFKNTFIDTKLVFDKIEIYGISVSIGTTVKDIEERKKELKKKFKTDKEIFVQKLNMLDELYKTQKDDRIDFLYWTCMGVDHNDDTVFYLYGRISELPGAEIYEEENDLDCSDIDKLPKEIDLFVCNFLDFITQPDVKLVTVKRTKEQNEKRIKRGRPKIPVQKFVRVDGELKIYLNKLKQQKEMFHFQHKFWVRGHWRTLRNPKWKEKRGTKIWIPPYIKGQGMLINKEYIVHNKDKDDD